MKHFPSLTPAARVGEWKYAPGSERPLHSDCDLDAELLVAIARGITGRRRAVALEDLRISRILRALANTRTAV